MTKFLSNRPVKSTLTADQSLVKRALSLWNNHITVNSATQSHRTSYQHVTVLTAAAAESAACHYVLETLLHQEPSANCSARWLQLTSHLPEREVENCIAYSSVPLHDQSSPVALSTAPYIYIIAHHMANPCKHSCNYISCLEKIHNDVFFNKFYNKYGATGKCVYITLKVSLHEFTVCGYKLVTNMAEANKI